MRTAIVSSRRSESTSAPSGVVPSGVAPSGVAGLQYELRRWLRLHLYDESGVAPAGIAIYSLADPREVRASRYIGQTAHPRRRLMQHVRTARLWLPDERPWWVKAPRLRPLYGWIRELYQQEGRLPVMIVHTWVEPPQARLAEREQIVACLERELPLLNVAICQMTGADLPAAP
jgi:hypothetical protein